MTPALNYDKYGSQHRWLLSSLLIAIVLLSLAPSLRLLFEALSDLTQGRQSPLWQVLNSASTWRALWHSLYTSGLGMLIALVLGSLFAFAITLTNIRGKAWLVFCFMLPMMIPPQVTALSWLQLFGPASPLLKSIGMAPPLGSRNRSTPLKASLYCWASRAHHWYFWRCAPACFRYPGN